MTKATSGRPDAVVTVPRLSADQRRVMVAGLLAHKDVFLHARHRLKPELFHQFDEVHLRCAWAAALALCESVGPAVLFGGDRNAAWTAVDSECRALFAAYPDAYPLTYFEALFQAPDGGRPPGFLAYAYSVCRPTEFEPAYVLKLLSDFLRERTVSDELSRVARDATGRALTNVSVLVDRLRDRELDIAALGEDPVESFAPDGWLPPPSRRRPTGIVWLDALLRGGHAAPETYGLLGVTGAGKTTFGLQLLAAVALQEQALAGTTAAAGDARVALGLPRDGPYEPGHCYYFHYEMPAAEIRKKAWSGLASVDIDRIEKLGNPGFSLASAAAHEPQDAAALRLISDELKIPLEDFKGEQERLADALVQLRRNMWLVDCSGGNPTNPRRGTGYLPELHQILANEVSKKGRRVALVVIDYAGACVDRHTTDKDLGYSLLTQFGRRCEAELSVPFDTPVWALHQLAGAEGGRTAATRQSHANAGGSKRFAENLWFCFNIGTADEKTGCRYFTVSKARRANLGSPPIIKVAGGYNKLVDVSRHFEFDPRGRITSRTGDLPAGVAAPPPKPAVSADEDDFLPSDLPGHGSGMSSV